MLGTLHPGAQPPTGSGVLLSQKSWQSAALWLHALGGALGGAAFGVLAGFSGRALPIDDRWTAALLAAAFVSALYALREAALLRVPAPQSSRQVPNRWRWEMPRALVAFLYGSSLGVGVATPITSTSYYPLVVWVVIRAEPALGGVVLGLFGVARALPLFLRTFDADGPSLRMKVDRLVVWGPLVALVNGMALALAAGFMLMEALRQ
jgi:hypothetical protein